MDFHKTLPEKITVARIMDDNAAQANIGAGNISGSVKTAEILFIFSGKNIPFRQRENGRNSVYFFGEIFGKNILSGSLKSRIKSLRRRHETQSISGSLKKAA